jgi:hypothetical protein
MLVQGMSLWVAYVANVGTGNSVVQWVMHALRLGVHFVLAASWSGDLARLCALMLGSFRSVIDCWCGWVAMNSLLPQGIADV